MTKHVVNTSAYIRILDVRYFEYITKNLSDTKSKKFTKIRENQKFHKINKIETICKNQEKLRKFLNHIIDISLSFRTLGHLGNLILILPLDLSGETRILYIKEN
ncbi:hypothetical protein Bhyg_09358 [Pseudolycoriella hygida]|uniref:Uncharacterized protein n=1 Tax=Pseudolycoriella hygida TaxID=35572 RepID=A0A9Q0N6H5_9DIPT|nr:hypothetical protein Bhyg_09358 [Pseudolycoriella hygida]